MFIVFDRCFANILEMKKLLLIAIVNLGLLTSGCTVLRYSYEPALNQVPKDATITKVTNDYVEYVKYSTNATQVNVVSTHVYRAHYTTEGKVFKTEQVK